MYKILKNIDFKMSGIDIKLNMEKIIKFTNKNPTFVKRLGFNCLSSFLCSRAVASQVFSALQSLTAVFGMGTGVSFASSPLSNLNDITLLFSLHLLLFLLFLGQALGLLVSVSLIHYCTYTPDLSTT